MYITHVILCTVFCISLVINRCISQAATIELLFIMYCLALYLVVFLAFVCSAFRISLLSHLLFSRESIRCPTLKESVLCSYLSFQLNYSLSFQLLFTDHRAPPVSPGLLRSLLGSGITNSPQFALRVEIPGFKNSVIQYSLVIYKETQEIINRM